MRLLNTLFMVLLLSGLAAAQATIIGGTASNWAPAYGVYAAPFVPLVTTPSVTLATVSPTSAGASNATAGNTAGATDATFSIASQPVPVYTEAVWYGSSAAGETSGENVSSGRIASRSHPSSFDIGAASWQSSESVTHLMAISAGAKKGSRSYSNQDVDQVNQKNGIVKYRGKTEHI